MFSDIRKTALIVIGCLLVVAFAALGILQLLKPKQMPAPAPIETPGPKHEVIGTSVEGRTINAYTYYGVGTGTPVTSKKHLVFVGGIHGGYEWNSVLLAYQTMDYLERNPGLIPQNLSVTIIPSANPDGLFKVVGKEGRFTAADVPDDKEMQTAGVGRFNANNVDLNRNFDCKWKTESMWRSKIVSAGTSPFSEPEAQAIRNFVTKYKPTAFIFWHSQANAVYASECLNGILPETRQLMTTYATAAGYPSVDSFDAYEVTGDAEGWLASIGVPAITVELSTHETIEWEKNLAGLTALLKHYGTK
jgi:hypothetical protein